MVYFDFLAGDEPGLYSDKASAGTGVAMTAVGFSCLIVVYCGKAICVAVLLQWKLLNFSRQKKYNIIAGIGVAFSFFLVLQCKVMK